MSDLANGALDMTSAVNIRKDLAGLARQLATTDPVQSVSTFRLRIKPYIDAGRAWLVEPAVRVLVTELRRDENAWAKVGLDAERLLEETDEGQANAVKLAVAATVDVSEPSLAPTIEDALIAPSSERTEQRMSGVDVAHVWPMHDLELVHLNCVGLNEKMIDIARWETLLIDPGHRLTFLGSTSQDNAIGFIDPILSPSRAFRYRFSLFRHFRNAWSRRAREDEVRRRVLTAMLTMPTHEAIVTVWREQVYEPYVDFYRCELPEASLARMVDRQIRISKVDVRRPAAQVPSDQLMSLAQELAQMASRYPALGNGIGVQRIEAA